MAASELAALSAWARGGGPVTYQWFKDGKTLPGARSAWLVLPNPQASDMGAYSVVESDSLGAITSRVAVVTVSPRTPILVLEPTSQIAAPGGTVKLNASARGTEPARYQWRLNGVELPGATDPTLTLDPCQGADTGIRVLAENSLGRALSRSATVTFGPTVDPFDLQADEAGWRGCQRGGVLDRARSVYQHPTRQPGPSSRRLCHLHWHCRGNTAIVLTLAEERHADSRRKQPFVDDHQRAA